MFVYVVVAYRIKKLTEQSIAKENMLSDVNKALRAVEVLSTENDSITVYQVEESLHHNLVEDWKFTLGSYFTSIELYNVEQKSRDMKVHTLYKSIQIKFKTM